MSEEINIFEDEKAKEIIWNQIIKDFARTNYEIDTFCRMKEIEVDELREHLNKRLEDFREKEFQNSIAFKAEDVVEIIPDHGKTDSEQRNPENHVTVSCQKMEIQIPLNAGEEIYRLIIKTVNEL